ncbi:small integral membrane protein 6 [Fukomys damarensis]|uniref:small integral membrane protein 6 n=1 Tax=Fukomys damarensis TaxID=885580 RepID=UPI00053F6138|nr:small integral membrane protein 6 [Fukomys damarensis]XP_010616704.1 small integral membrane protein 6 [Fukomys damarensis]XP_019062219.1 small integral membrane protein 6 [Fukomys damarensis]
MDQILLQKDIWHDEFWENPWDLAGLIIISLFIATVLFFILFAIMFGLLFPGDSTEGDQQ